LDSLNRYHELAQWTKDKKGAETMNIGFPTEIKKHKIVVIDEFANVPEKLKGGEYMFYLSKMGKALQEGRCGQKEYTFLNGDITVVLFVFYDKEEDDYTFVRSMVIRNDEDKKNKKVAIEEAKRQAIRYLLGRDGRKIVKNRKAVKKLQKGMVPFISKVRTVSLCSLHLFEVPLIPRKARKKFHSKKLVPLTVR
jgi:hypothetical protein